MPEALDAARLRTALLAPSGPYAALDVVASTGSTNADLRAAATDGSQDRTVLLAEEQTSGVGRRARSWSSPKGTGIYCSVLLRPAEVPYPSLGSLALVAGLAILDVTGELGVDATLKWPNDVLAGDPPGKCAGVLAEAVAADEAAVVLGIGLNVRPLPRGQVPPGPGGLPPTSLAEQGATSTDRTEVAARLLTALAARESRWRAAHGDLAAAGMLGEYRDRCATIGQQVKVLLPGGKDVRGRAAGVDPSGQLELDTNGERRLVFAGDVVHVRSAD